MDKIGTNWWKLAEIGWNWLKLRGGEILWPFFLQGNLRAKFIDETYSRLKKIERNWVKLNEIGWNWVKLRVAIFAIFLTFVISCNFRQFWPIFVAVSGDLIGHFLYTSNLTNFFRDFPKMQQFSLLRYFKVISLRLSS